MPVAAPSFLLDVWLSNEKINISREYFIRTCLIHVQTHFSIVIFFWKYHEQNRQQFLELFSVILISPPLGNGG